MDWLYDKRTDCWSVQTSITITEYLAMVNEAHQSQGALVGQRDVLTTTTARRIRARMVRDLQLGAVLPPLVIGAVLDEDVFEAFPLSDAATLTDVLTADDLPTLSIIDGMQRTAAIMDAVSLDAGVNERSIRVEFWLAKSVRAMIYRMLVLNTGQVPWTMSRQLSVVFAPLLKEIKENVPELDKMPSPDNPGRRVAAGQYSSDAIVELYIAFSLRKTAVDAKESVSDEFSRLDFVDNLSDNEFQRQFYEALAMMAKLDKAFSSFETGMSGRFAKGRNIFDGQPARIGFIVAVGVAVLGRPGADRGSKDRAEKMSGLRGSLDTLITKMAAMDETEMSDFLRLEVLQEVLDRRVGQVGRYERAVFAEAFKVLIEERFEVSDLEQCWRAN